VAVSSAMLIIAGCVSMVSFWEFNILEQRKESLVMMINYFKQKNIKYSVCTDTMLPWQIIFYSKGEHISKAHFYPGRYPLYDQMVTNALEIDSNSVAVVQFTGEKSFKIKDSVQFTFFTLGYGVSKDTLAANGFYFE
jgi:hypothetical protein